MYLMTFLARKIYPESVLHELQVENKSRSIDEQWINCEQELLPLYSGCNAMNVNPDSVPHPNGKISRASFRTMLANMPIIFVLFSLSWVVGMVIFANYADCDPLTLGYISKFDEIVPFYVEDKFLNFPGLLGLVMATLFNSALTLAVSNLNSLATVTFEDFLGQIPALRELKDKQQLHLIKVISVIYGVLIIGVSFLVAMLSGVIESSLLMTSATSGPLLGVFVLAMLVPCANWKGAATGMIFSHVTTLWITFGHLSIGNMHKAESLPLSTENCQNDTFSPWVTQPDRLLYAALNVTNNQDQNVPLLNAIQATSARGPLEYLYSITYMYYALIGSLSTVIVGIIVSLLTANPQEDMYEQHLLHPLAVKISRHFPGRRRLYASSTRLQNEQNAANATASSSVTSIANAAEKTAPLQGIVDDTGKLHINVGYMEKLNALKNVSLDVTNEVSKGTRLWEKVPSATFRTRLQCCSIFSENEADFHFPLQLLC